MTDAQFYQHWAAAASESRDGLFPSGDGHDVAYAYSTPRVGATGCFSDFELAHLMMLRGRVQDARLYHSGRYADDLSRAYPAVSVPAILDGYEN